MSTIVGRIGDYAAGLRPEHLEPVVLDYAKRILLDSLTCGFGGLESEPARIVRHGISDLGGYPQATLIGMGGKANAQFAALANGVAIRYQDYNDVYFGPAWTAHPSDTIATVLAAAEWRKSSGMEFLLGLIVSYEVQMRFSDLPVPKNLWHRGWRTFRCEVLYPKGDPVNPMTWDDVAGKFMKQTEHVLDRDLARTIIDRTKEIDKDLDVSVFAGMLGRAGIQY